MVSHLAGSACNKGPGSDAARRLVRASNLFGFLEPMYGELPMPTSVNVSVARESTRLTLAGSKGWVRNAFQD